MTNAELAKWLNDQSDMNGPNTITTNIVRQWVEWDLLPRATATGQRYGFAPKWSRTEISIRRALRLAELRKFNTRRENALIVHAYIEWGHPDFGRVKDALEAEWDKWAKQLIRRQISFMDDSEFSDLSRTKQLAIANQLGPLDNRLKGTAFELPLQFYAAFAEMARTGTIAKSDADQFLQNALEQFYPGLSRYVPADCMAAVANAFLGITGPEDEIGNSAAIAIKGASELQFRKARHRLRIALKHLRRITASDHPEISNFDFREFSEIARSIGPQVFTGPWIVSLFTITLIGTVRE